jgi:putative ABC transport system permease protein
MGIPLQRGRDFTDSDNTLESPCRFIISQSLARQYFPGEVPLGQRISVNMRDQNPFGEIIGIAGDVREDSLEKDPAPTVYYIHSQLPGVSMYFVVRAAGDPLLLAAPARRVIHDLEPKQPLSEMDTMQKIVRETFSRQTFIALLLGGFSLISLLLAAIGIYGVLAYSVTERTREFGVRVALGARPSSILSLVLSGAARIVLAGTAAGIAGAWFLTNLLRSLLFSVAPHDTATFVTVPLVLALVALIAAWIPARRAANLTPIDALRED